MKYGHISEVPPYNLSSVHVVIQCLITFLAMSITFLAVSLNGAQVKSNGFECKNKRRLACLLERKKMVQSGSAKAQMYLWCFLCSTNNSAIKITLDKTCLWTITCHLALGLRMIKANPKESGIHHLTLIGNM